MLGATKLNACIAQWLRLTSHMDKSTQQPAIEIKSLIYHYPHTANIAVGIDHLSILNSQQVVLTGQSGCGKSTLLHLIAGLMNPTSGGICVAGVPLESLKGSRRDRFRGQHIGMVFQTFQLLQGFRVIENILAALMFSDLPRKEHRDRAVELLDNLGINTHDARVEELSVGQQQRVAVARALACKPTVVLADEPTAALDPEYANTAMDLLQEACRANGSALICVTHDHSLIARFDRHERIEDLGGDGSHN